MRGVEFPYGEMARGRLRFHAELVFLVEEGGAFIVEGLADAQDGEVRFDAVAT